MTAALRLALTLFASLLLWLPTVPSALAHNTPPETVALRYLAALVVSRIGVGLLFRVVRTYAAPVLEGADEDASARPDPADEDVAAGEPLYGRRSEDADEDERLTEALDEVEDTTTLVP